MFALLLGAIAGCSSPLPYSPRDPQRAEARADFEARRLDSAALRAFLDSAGLALPALGASWDLDTLALVAGWFSPEVAVAQSRWQQSLLGRTYAAALPGPLLDSFAEHHSWTDAQRPVPWTLGLGLEFTLPDAERVAARRALAEGDIDLARLELARTLWSVRQGVRAGWIAVRDAAARLVLIRRMQAIQAQRSERTAMRLGAGVLGAGDLLEARQGLRAADAALAEQERSHEEAQAELRRALGLPPSLPDLPPLASRTVALPEGLPEHAPRRLVDQALADRLDLQQAEARFRSADAAVRLEVARQYPEIGLKPGYEWDQGDHRLRIGLAFPISLPAARRGPVALALADRELRAKELLALQEAVLQQVDEGWREVEEARQRVGDQQALIEVWRARLASLDIGIRAGAVDPLERLDLELAGLAQELTGLDARRRLEEALGRLEDAVQQPLQRVYRAADAETGS